MNRYALKYGCNPNQQPASIYVTKGELPITILSGRPGYINLLDAVGSWQLVRELSAAVKLPAAASFKHVSPTSSAAGIAMGDAVKKACFVDDIDGLDDSPIACAYARARGTDRMSSFGDWAALSCECDETTARILRREVSDGIIAPSYTKKALEILCEKKQGNYNIIRINPDYTPEDIEIKQVFGMIFEQRRNDCKIDAALLENVVTKNKTIPDSAKLDLIISLITLKYTQSNSVCFAEDGQAIGVGAGQQSRIHCTRLAAGKADNWHLRQHERVLNLPFKDGIARADRDNAIDLYISETDSADILADGAWQRVFSKRPAEFTAEEKAEYLAGISGVALGSDAFFPFGDNIERAYKSGVTYIAQPGGSKRDAEVTGVCDSHGMAMAFTGLRLFHH